MMLSVPFLKKVHISLQKFVNNTQTFQINDARQLPIIIPNAKQLEECKIIFDNAIELKKKQFRTNDENIKIQIDAELDMWQKKLDAFVLKLYGLE